MLPSEVLWEELKKLCCSDPETAKKIVMLSEKQFYKAVERAANNYFKKKE